MKMMHAKYALFTDLIGIQETLKFDELLSKKNQHPQGSKRQVATELFMDLLIFN